MKIPSEPIRKERICQNLTEALGKSWDFRFTIAKQTPKKTEKKLGGPPLYYCRCNIIWKKKMFQTTNQLYIILNGLHHWWFPGPAMSHIFHRGRPFFPPRKVPSPASTPIPAWRSWEDHGGNLEIRWNLPWISIPNASWCWNIYQHVTQKSFKCGYKLYKYIHGAYGYDINVKYKWLW